MPYTFFPLHPIDSSGSCVCSEGPACTRPGKHPAIRWGELKAGEQVQGPAGHAIATGIRSGVFVVDTDGPEADARYRAFCSPVDLETYTVRTPSGGRHYYFAHPGFPVRGSVGEFDWSEELDGRDEKGRPHSTKIDIRGEGNMAVMPGSPHRSGRAYEVERNVPPAVAPAWLLEWDGLEGRDVSTGENAPVPVDTMTPEGQRRVTLGREACQTFPASVKGDNGSGALFNLALRLIRDLEIPIDTAAELVDEAYNPRCDPAWTGPEVLHKLESARDKSDRPCGIFSAGFVERLMENALAVTPAPDITRKVPDPAHRYECSIGDASAGEPRKCSQGQVLAELYGNPSWAGVLQHDAFRDRVFAVNPPVKLPGAECGNFCDEDLTAIRHWFECMGHMSVSKDAAWDCATAVAKANAFHPLQDYLNGLEPAEGAISELCAALGLSDAFDQLYIRRFMIAAVRRVFEPGCKVDNVLVLHGVPGLKKSTFVVTLFGQEWTSENLTNIEDAKAVGEVLQGKWAVELAEMKDLMRAGNETVAAFITRRTERFRAAYARGNAKDYPRSCVLVGSTNETDLLRNATGADARRFWIVEPSKIDIPWVAENRDRVWGEAIELARAGEVHWLEGEEADEHMARVKKYEEQDPWHEAVEVYCIGRDYVRPEELWKSMGGTVDKFDPRTKRRVLDTLRRLGCTPGCTGPRRTRVWLVPESLKAGELPSDEKERRASASLAERLARN